MMHKRKFSEMELDTAQENETEIDTIDRELKAHAVNLCTNGLITPDIDPARYRLLPLRYDLTWQLRQTLRFLHEHTMPTGHTTLPLGSYGLKHMVERDAKRCDVGYYVCNGIAILACRLAGLGETSQGDRNVAFQIALRPSVDFDDWQKFVRRTREYRWFPMGQVLVIEACADLRLPESVSNLITCGYLALPPLRLDLNYRRRALQWSEVWKDVPTRQGDCR